jgi:hypothetical protein
MINRGSWLSKTIAWFMGSKWSHVALVMEQTDRFCYITETSDYEVVVHILDDYISNKDYMFEVYRPINLTDGMKLFIVTQSLFNLGATYGYLQLLSLGLRRLLMRIGIRIDNFSKQGIICVGHVLYGYYHSNIIPLNMLDPESIDTEEFYQIVKALPDFEKVWEKC